MWFWNRNKKNMCIKDGSTRDINVIVHLNMIKEQFGNGSTRFLCTTRCYFLWKCPVALDERCSINMFMFQHLCFKVTNALLTSLNHTLSTTTSPICTLSASSMGSLPVALVLSSSMPIISSTIGMWTLFRSNSNS